VLTVSHNEVQLSDWLAIFPGRMTFRRFGSAGTVVGQWRLRPVCKSAGEYHGYYHAAPLLVQIETAAMKNSARKSRLISRIPLTQSLPTEWPNCLILPRQART
jgi:hypothetical protein